MTGSQAIRSTKVNLKCHYKTCTDTHTHTHTHTHTQRQTDTEIPYIIVWMKKKQLPLCSSEVKGHMLKTGMSFKCMDAKSTHCRVHYCYHPWHNALEWGYAIGGHWPGSGPGRNTICQNQHSNLVMLQASFHWCVISRYSLYCVPTRWCF